MKKLLWLLLLLSTSCIPSNGQTALTVTCVHTTMHTGDLVPPFIYTVYNGSTLANGGSTYFSTAPSCSSTVSSSSGVGTYTITANAGATQSGYTATYVNGAVAVIAASKIGAALTNGTTYPSGFFSGPNNPALDPESNPICNVTAATGTGVPSDTDDTACWQELLQFGRGTPTATVTTDGSCDFTITAGQQMTGMTASFPITILGVVYTVTTVSSSTAGTTAVNPTSGGCPAAATGSRMEYPPSYISCNGTTTGTWVSGPQLAYVTTGAVLVAGAAITVTGTSTATSVTFTTACPTTSSAAIYLWPNTTANYGTQVKFFWMHHYYAVSQPMYQEAAFITYFGNGAQTSGFYLLPNSSQFQGSATAFINPQSLNGNDNFEYGMYNMGVHVGAGNPAAIPLTNVGNNIGSSRNMQIWTDDSACPYGIAFNRSYPGPYFWKEIAVYGCGYGLWGAQIEYIETFEGLTLEGQTQYAIYNQSFKFALRHVLSDNAVQFLSAQGSTAASTVILDSALLNGSGVGMTNASGSTLTVKNTTIAGYSPAITDTGTGTPVSTYGNITLQWTGTAQTLFSGSQTPNTLGLPESETPQPSDPAQSTWVNLGANPNNWCANINSSSVATVYVAPGQYIGGTTASCTITNTAVTHIIFYHAMRGAAAYQINFTLTSMSGTPLIVDGAPYESTSWTHSGSQTFVLLDSEPVYYTATTGAGNVYFEDVDDYPSPAAPFTFVSSQSVWAWQLDLEQTGASKIVCTGCTLWVLGYKTEQATGTYLSANARAEIYGHFAYSNQSATGIINSALWTVCNPVTGGSSYAVNDIATVVYSGASGGQCKVTSVSSGVVTNAQYNAEGYGYPASASGLGTTDSGSGTGYTVGIYNNSLVTRPALYYVADSAIFSSPVYTEINTANYGWPYSFSETQNGTTLNLNAASQSANWNLGMYYSFGDTLRNAAISNAIIQNGVLQ